MTLRKTLSIKRHFLILGVAFLAGSPITASAASDSDNTTINATLGNSISISSGGTVAVSITPDGDGQASSNSDTVLVSTNDSDGFNLTLENGDATTTLGNGVDTIAAHSGTQASPTTLGNNSWGYRVLNIGGFGNGATSAETNVNNLANTWAGVPAQGSSNLIKNYTSGAATNDSTTVWYGVKADTSKSDGVYSDTVTYSATTI